MKATDKAVISGLLVAALLVGFYVMVLSPKRSEAGKLGDEIVALEASIADQEQLAVFAEEARKDFPRYYGRMVVLGKAVPEQGDSASLLVQLSSIADASDTKFRSLTLGQNGGESAGAASTTASTTTTTPAPGTAAPEGGTAATSSETTTETTTTAAPAPATESAAAILPIGATVGPAGLPTLPYSMVFNGTFFDVADFMSGVDGMVSSVDDGTRVSVDGRLLTIDGFSLIGGAPGSNPELEAQFAITSYVTPVEQGLTLGATPSSPAPVGGPATTTPASAVATP